MGSGKRSFLDDLVGLPWPVGLVVSALGYLAMAHGIPMWFARYGGPLAQAFAGPSSSFSLLAWLFSGMCAVAALASFLRTRHNRQPLDTRTGLDSIVALRPAQHRRLSCPALGRRGAGDRDEQPAAFRRHRRTDELAFGRELGVPEQVTARHLDRLCTEVPQKANELLDKYEDGATGRLDTGEARLLRQIVHGPLGDRVRALQP